MNYEIEFKSLDGSIKKRYAKIVYPDMKKKKYPVVIATHYEVDFSDYAIKKLLDNGIAVATPSQMQIEDIRNIFADNVEFHLEYIKMIYNLEDIDKERIAFRGGSAGGFMALYMAKLFPWVRCVYCMSGVSNFYYQAKYLENPNNCELEGVKAVNSNFKETIDYLKNQEAYDKYSMILHLESVNTHILLLHSTADSMVPINQFVDIDNEKKCITGVEKLVDKVKYKKTLKDYEKEMTIGKYRIKSCEGKVVPLKFKPNDKISFNIIEEGPVDNKSMHFKNCNHNDFSEVEFLFHYLK